MIQDKVTLKLDVDGRLCAWPGNVQSRIVLDDHKHPYVPGLPVIGRYDDRMKFDIMNRFRNRIEQRVLLERASVVVMREEAGL
jgi:hypothetical protein